MGHKLITQIILISVSLVIIFTFIKPMFGEIEIVQESLFQYRDTVAKASEFNNRLGELIQTESSFSRQEIQALETFLPTQLDPHVIMRDIKNIFQNQGLTISSLESSGELSQVVGRVADTADLEDKKIVTYQEFDVTFRATYRQLREVLSSLESNAFLLEVAELSFSGEEKRGLEDFAENETDESTYALKLRVYALPGLN